MSASDAGPAAGTAAGAGGGAGAGSGEPSRAADRAAATAAPKATPSKAAAPLAEQFRAPGPDEPWRSLAIEPLLPALRAVVASATDTGVAIAVTGGAAAVLHGAIRSVHRLDVLVRAAEAAKGSDDGTSVVGALAEAVAGRRVAAKDDGVVVVSTAAAGAMSVELRPVSELPPVETLAVAGLHADTEAGSPCSVSVVARKSLVATKAASGRAVDVLDVDLLERPGGARFPQRWVHGSPEAQAAEEAGRAAAEAAGEEWHGEPDSAPDASSEAVVSRWGPRVQVVWYDADTAILRVNKTVHYEANFMLMLFGGEKVLLLDTGPVADNKQLPLVDVVKGVVDEWVASHAGADRPHLIVGHTHAHGDHIAADSNFRAAGDCTVVGCSAEEVAEFYGVRPWPAGPARYSLGNDRALDIFGIPGHEGSDIAVYDERTGLLLTGDTVYPGRLYVRDQAAFRASVARLAAFVRSHVVTFVIGCHIEMRDSSDGVDYPMGTRYHPDECQLQLLPSAILALDAAVKAQDGVLERTVLPKHRIIVVPLTPDHPYW